MVLLPPECNESEALHHIKENGGAAKIVKHPFSAKDVFFTVLNVLYSNRQVEDTYADLRRRKVISSKYPYLPLFEAADASAPAGASAKQRGGGLPPGTGGAGVGGAPGPAAGNAAFGSAGKATEQAQGPGGTTTRQTHGHDPLVLTPADFNIEEVEDVTECSSLLPEFIHDRLESDPELLSPYKQMRRRKKEEAYGAVFAEIGQQEQELQRMAQLDSENADDNSMGSGTYELDSNFKPTHRRTSHASAEGSGSEEGEGGNAGIRSKRHPPPDSYSIGVPRPINSK